MTNKELNAWLWSVGIFLGSSLVFMIIITFIVFKN